MAPKAYLCIVLHAHLPYVRRPDLPAAFEEDWLFEGITETYLPLLDTLDRLALEKVPYRLVISLSPTLCEMLRDKLLISRYKGHLERSIALARKEVDRLADDPDAGPVARMYLAFFEKARELFTKRYLEDIPAAFMRLARMGGVELATTCATHAFLPLQMTNQPAAFAQIRLAAQHFKNLTGARPSGFWLPECGYDPSLERALLNEGVRWTIVDALGILAAKPSPPRGVLAPVRSPSGLTFSAGTWRPAARCGTPGRGIRATLTTGIFTGTRAMSLKKGI